MSWLRRRQEQDETSIPMELIASIETADIAFRPSVDDTGAPRVLVRASGLGAFHYEGKAETADRITRMWGLPHATARRAAKLLAQAVAQRNRDMHAARPARARGSSYVREAYRDLPGWMQ